MSRLKTSPAPYITFMGISGSMVTARHALWLARLSRARSARSTSFNSSTVVASTVLALPPAHAWEALGDCGASFLPAYSSSTSFRKADADLGASGDAAVPVRRVFSSVAARSKTAEGMKLRGDWAGMKLFPAPLLPVLDEPNPLWLLANLSPCPACWRKASRMRVRSRSPPALAALRSSGFWVLLELECTSRTARCCAASRSKRSSRVSERCSST
mmetsp:Transcript_97152/g.231182  ORF Transcript_97152/g.231182 Transcript_97152/m.231182 type:complete len:215 (-) Transcript_97152:1000-1644(-)